MWKSAVEIIKPKRIHKVCLFSDNKQITYSEIINLWQQNFNFRSFFVALLAECEFSAYFWETPAINKCTIDRPFEFILADSPKLATVSPNPNSFKQYFKSTSEEVATFLNLGNDALLVVPCPRGEITAYPHLAEFVRQAPSSQLHLLWQTVGKAIALHLQEKPIWVSTSGLGVHWLHIRLDSRPKYYTYHPYKNAIVPAKNLDFKISSEF